MKKYLILFAILVVFVVLGFAVGTFDPARWQESVFCPADVQMCSDGSYVSRTGPKCEFAQCASGTVVPAANIRVYQPVAGDTVGYPLVIVGQARVFENTFNYRLVDKEGHQLAGSYSTAVASEAGQYGGFSVALEYTYPGFSEGFVEVFTHSAKDGAEIDLVRIPVRLTDRQDSVVKAFFDNEQAKPRDPQTGVPVEQCEGVFPVFRTVPKTTAVAQSALSELFKGPTDVEQKAGYSTAINSGVKVRSLKIVDSVATADLTSDITKELGGSCRVGMIIHQIDATLRQFKTIHSVNVLVDGKPDALQP